MNYLDNITLNEDFGLNKHQYYPRSFPKNQLYIHHTVSGSARSSLSWWNQTSERVGTWCVIDKDGTVYRAFSSKYWAHHLYIQSKPNRIPQKYKKASVNYILNRQSIGIELVSMGGLVKGRDGMWYDDYGQCFEDHDNIVFYPNGYRGYEAYEKYTDAQIDALKWVLLYLCDSYGIPKNFNKGMFELSEDALKGKPGIWTHTSVRSDKSDCHPQEELKCMLEYLA